jgi:pantothenate kinase type III
VRGVILGSVVPPLTGTILTMIERYFGVKAMVVEPGVNTGMPILYENPSEVGADRIVNGCRRVGAIRQERWPSDDRRRLRDRDDARRDYGEG